MAKRRRRKRAWKQQLERNRVVVRFPRPWERWDEISPGWLVAWAEWRGGREKAGAIH